MKASTGFERRSSSEVIWRLRGSVPSRHTRAISAPKTVSTAPPARMPSTRVRLLGLLRAASAAASRLALRVDTGARPPAQVRLSELLGEDHSELDQGSELRAHPGASRTERRQLLGEVPRADLDDPGADQLRTVVLALRDVPSQ